MAYRQRFQSDINNVLSGIIETEFPGLSVYEGQYNAYDNMFVKINKVTDQLNDLRRNSSDRQYNINLQFFIKNFYPRKRNKSLDMGMRNAERLRQLFFSYKNQLIVSNKFFTADGERFILSDGNTFSVRKNQDDIYAYHNLNVNNVNMEVGENKNYIIFNFDINADIEKLVIS